MPRNILVVGVNEKCLNFVVEGKLSIFALKEAIRTREGVPIDSYFLVQDGSPVEDSYELQDADEYTTTIIRAYPIIRGGKGGFGSLIRAMGMQINKSTNKNACRDLSGRRVRDVNAEKDIAEWIKKEPERRRQKMEEKRKRLEKRRAEPKHYFSDPKYMEQIQSTSEEIQDALKQGMEVATSSKAVKRKNVESDTEGSSKKTKLWLGMEGLTSGSDEDSEGATDASEQSPDTQEEGYGIESGGVTSSDGGVTLGDGQHSDPNDAKLKAEGHHAGGHCAASTERATAHEEHCATSHSDVQEGHATSHSDVQEGHATTSASSSSRGPAPSITVAKECDEVVCLDHFSSAEELEAVGAERLKTTLQAMGLKCGGTVKERAQRLFSTKGKTLDQVDRALFAKPTKQKK